ncbi:hypothetical protein LLT7_13475 [Lactococcus cremoris subsp. cremoris TIFN7]|nr:hypothetical protein LLT7_13475 [Lactococcus cremoris subsp. cremoris TIFN7]
MFDFFNIKLGALLQKNIYTINIYDRIFSSSANSQWRNIIWMLLLGLIVAFIGSIFYVLAIGKVYR